MEPVANPSVVEGELRRALNSSRTVPGNSVLLLRAAPEWRGDATFTMEVDAGQVTVTVAKCQTVLAVLDAIGTSRDDGGYLVVLTPCETSEVGESVLARAMQPEIKPINRWDLVQDAFGARRLDPALTRSENRWMAEALLDAQPAGGWRRLAGPVLTRATALNRLAATRLGIRDADDSAVDAAALLEWTTDASAVASFLQLRDAERVGLVDWLAQSVGPVADVVFAMDASGKVPDAVPFGLAIAALYEGADGQERRRTATRWWRGSGRRSVTSVVDRWKSGCCRRSAWPPSHWSSAGPTTGTRRRQPRCASGPSPSSPSSPTASPATWAWSARAGCSKPGSTRDWPRSPAR